MTTSLKDRALRGVFWSFLGRIGDQGVYFTVAIILARLLAPEQFGLVGMLSIFIAVAQVFIDSGFAMALIQKKEATNVDKCSIFYFNIVVGFLAAGLLCAASPWIAAFYRRPILMPLMCALSTTLVINSFGGIQTALLSKYIDFKTQLKVGVAAITLSGAIGIAMAVMGFGVWSLVAQNVGGSIFRTMLLWRLSSWRPTLLFRLDALREMFGFGSRLFASSLLNTTFENIYFVVIGRLFSAAQLGLYSGASKIQNLATINITGVVTQVAFPVFSLIQDDPVRLKRSMRKAMMVLAFVNFPLMVGLALVARPLVYVLLTEKWAASIYWLQLLCVAGLLYPFQALHLNALNAKGRSDLFLKLEVLKKVLIAILVAITYRWGVTGIIWGQIGMSVCHYYINSYYTSRLIHYSLREQLTDLAPYAAVSAVMGAGVYIIQSLPFTGYTVPLLMGILLGVSLYVALSYLLGLSAFLEMTSAARDRLRPHIRAFLGG
jgi:teichuronic acid exporter